MIITLIGYRGCGKSSVAPLLADALQCEWVDSDAVIEERAGCSIRQIFESEGETGFRLRETETLQALTAADRASTSGCFVIAAGGGAILAERNRELMKNAGPVVWLDAPDATLAARIAGDINTASRRPSLTGQSVTDEVTAVMSIRRPIYLQTATITVDADANSPDEVCRLILSKLNRGNGAQEVRS
ncbi:MAG: shikimate kinase [Planctomycetaceae bacterium]|nr:shikimate kinase [Planctomycetaceae bacterium]